MGDDKAIRPVITAEDFLSICRQLAKHAQWTPPTDTYLSKPLRDAALSIVWSMDLVIQIDRHNMDDWLKLLAVPDRERFEDA